MSDNCFHCFEPIPDGINLSVEYDHQSRPMCCLGCQAVAETIIEQGMSDYYKYRTENANKVQELVPDQIKVFKRYDDKDIQSDFLTVDGDCAEILLSVEGISCAACAWLIEKQLLKLNHIVRVNVDTSTYRAMVKWDQAHLKLSTIIEALARIGYSAYPFQQDREEQQRKQIAKSYVRRLGLAGLMTMQVMMFAFAMYFGMFSGMENDFEQYFRWISFALATPVILYCALPFFTSAIKGLKAKQLNMDLPVSIAIFGAYAASSWATVFQTGEVYFESICMFTFLLLLGRYLEFRARLLASTFSTNLQKLLPLTARLFNQEEEIIAAKNLKLGDKVLLKAGETIPADGVVISGKTTVNEAMMTGEHEAVVKTVNDQVYAGTINHDGVITVRVNKLGQDTLLNQIVKLQYQALSSRPKIAEITDKVAQVFVGCLLIFASITAFFWYQVDPASAFWITIAVLVATCPCALSLAIPTALTCAMAKLTQKGVLIKQAHVLETLSQVSHIAFDKTGTITEGKFALTNTVSFNKEYTILHIHSLAKSLESYSEHPIAKAFTDLDAAMVAIKEIKIDIGKGVSAIYGDDHIAIGKANWWCSTDHINDHSFEVFLYVNNALVAGFCLQDKVRHHAQETISLLQDNQIDTSVLTGDPSKAGIELIKSLGIANIFTNCSPSDKQKQVEALTQQGAIVAMVGDGVNDSPVFNSAHLSIAMASGADISKNTADVVLLHSELYGIAHLFNTAQLTRTVIKQNLALSLCYNCSILPLAAMGLVPPWAAVIGMSTSSLLVIGNSLRLLKRG